MKRLFICFAILFAINFTSIAQSPQKFNYQAVVRDNAGVVIKNQLVSFRIAIVLNNPSGFEVYSETHAPTTNEFGLVNFEVGGGVVISGSMALIDWGADIYFIKIGLDATGGSNYTLMGTSQLLAVPYALYAEKAGNVNNNDTSATNEIQDLQLTKSNLLLITNNPNANPINLNNYYDNTDSQKLSISGDTIRISNGNEIVISDAVNDADADPMNEIQFLSFTNDTLLLSNGGFAYLGNYDNRAAINQLFLKLAADSIYLKQLIDYNASSISTLQQNLNSLAAKQQSDSATLASDIKNVSDDLTTETTNRINEDAAITAKHATDSSLFANNLAAINTALGTETANRTAADNSIIAKHNSDSSLMANNLTALNTALNTESTNRIAGDNTLSNKEISDSSYLHGLISTNTGNISSNASNMATNTTNINTNATNITTNAQAINSLNNKEIADSSFLNGLINTNANNLNTHISTDADVDSTNEIQTLSRAGLNISLSKTSGSVSVADDDSDSLNELQTISISNDTIILSNGGFVKLPIQFDGEYSSLSNKPNFPDSISNYAVLLKGNQTFSGNKVFVDTISANNRNIINVANPINEQDVATKAYVDSLSINIRMMEDILIKEGLFVVKDIDGNFYHGVKIGTQVWTKENLKTSKYNDGATIPLVTNDTVWNNLVSPGYCWYNNDSANYEGNYGKLYNWYTISTGKLCPTGWHAPSDVEWTTLITYYGGLSIAGSNLKGNVFAGLLGGYRNQTGFYYGMGSANYWWSCTQSNTTAWHFIIYSGLNSVSRSNASNHSKQEGYYIRCIKD